MIGQHLILQKAVDLLEADSNTRKYKISQSDLINQNINNSPWAGVYPENEEFTPAYLGGVENWEREIAFRVVVQQAFASAGKTAEEKISTIIKNVINAITEERDTNWNGLIDLFTNIRIEHGFREDESGTVRFRESVIIFSGTAASDVS